MTYSVWRLLNIVTIIPPWSNTRLYVLHQCIVHVYWLLCVIIPAYNLCCVALIVPMIQTGVPKNKKNLVCTQCEGFEAGCFC
jgi:hypothetical protein